MLRGFLNEKYKKEFVTDVWYDRDIQKSSQEKTVKYCRLLKHNGTVHLFHKI